ncbi:hypothetical protein ABZ793_22065 [Micromonospora sp. NPDC047465]|uniref:hypothetical protein n=1 Tax=Micromonospora sp. NPDC047465 TaxID=3154813 RepID=UPI0034023B83
MNIFTVLAAVFLYLWLPLSIAAAVIAVAVLLAWSAVRSPRDTQSEQLRSARRATVAAGLAAALAVVRLATGFWRAIRRGVASLPVALRSLTVEPPPGGAFNDSRDVWPMPRDD